MALFKISKGLKANLPSAKTAGHCWYTIDDSLFYIDYEDENGAVQRKALNAKDAETLCNASLAQILNENELEIPTSKAVFDALNKHIDFLIDVNDDKTCNRTSAEIDEAYAEGRILKARYQNVVFPFISYSSRSKEYLFSNIFNSNTNGNVIIGGKLFVNTSNDVPEISYGLINEFFTPQSSTNLTTTKKNVIQAINEVNEKLAQSILITPINADGTMTIDAFMALENGYYDVSKNITVYSNDGSETINISGLTCKYSEYYIECYSLGRYLEVYPNNNGNYVLHGSYALDGFGEDLAERKLNAPMILGTPNVDNGTSGQLLSTNGDGTTSWIDIPEQIQSDWSINDESNPAHMKNRTHYVETTIETICSVENLTFNHETSDKYPDTGYGYNGSTVSPFDFFIVGGNYTVIFDGVTYKNLEAILHSDGDISIGAPSWDTMTTDMPFYIETTMWGNIYLCCYAMSDATSHSYSIVGPLETVHKLDSKYLNGKLIKRGSAENAEIFNNTDANEASALYAHAEGNGTTASGNSSHAEGVSAIASGDISHAEGLQTKATGNRSHAEGTSSEATNTNAHAEGASSVASGNTSHAEGYWTIAAGRYQHAQGSYNIEDTEGKYAHIVGNGTKSNARSNAHTLNWDGTAWFAKTVKVGGTNQDDANAKTLATTEYVDNKFGWEILMDVTLEEECVEAIGITLTAEQKEKVANCGEFVCYAQCPPPSDYEANGWINGGLWADNMCYFILTAYGQPSGVVPSSTDTYTSQIYGTLKNASGDMRVRDVLYTANAKIQYCDFYDTTEFMTNYQAQQLSVRFKTNGVFAAGTRLVCKVR